MTDLLTLVPFEFEILNDCVLEKPRPWGAAVGAALEFLRGAKCIDSNGNVTALGYGTWLGQATPEQLEELREKRRNAMEALVRSKASEPIPPNIRHVVFQAVRGVIPQSLDDAHDLAMAAKEAVFRAQDACSIAWEKEPDNRKAIEKAQKRLATVRVELEDLDREVRNSRRSRREDE